MDPLSGVLSLLKPQNSMCGGFDVGGAWSIQFPTHEGIKCYAVVSGACWLAVDGVSEAVHLEAGDCVLLPLGRPFRLASDLALPPVDFWSLYKGPLNGGIVRWNGGSDVIGVGSYFGLAGPHADILLGVLPPIVHIQGESARSVLRWSMERMMQELRDPQPGGHLVLQHLAHMMLVQALRGAPGGWPERRRWLALRAVRPSDVRRHPRDARRPRAPVDPSGARRSRRDVAVKLRPEVQAGRRRDPHRLFDPLAHAPRRRPPRQFQRPHLRDFPLPRV